MTDLGDFLNTSRKEYNLGELVENSIDPNPINQFGTWMANAVDAGVQEPNALTLSTVNMDGRPSSRIVLLRSYDQQGFIFYTNFNSRKGSDISENPYGCMNFFWPDLHRQIRIEGAIEKVSNEISDKYFNSRPRESRIGAWVSDQSGILDSREILDSKFKEFVIRFENQEIPRPPHWGGYSLKPRKFEFWQGRTSRLHDRIEYLTDLNGNWIIRRLYP
ncbi:MAG: pyridoxamine 5'-phosphate oxidase [Bacteroidota bacterium]